MGRFRASSLGAGAVILALLLLILHRFGTFLLFLVIGIGLLWYGRIQRDAQESAARRGGEEGAGSGSAPSESDDASGPDRPHDSGG
jgi:hypothetical protein